MGDPNGVPILFRFKDAKIDEDYMITVKKFEFKSRRHGIRKNNEIPPVPVQLIPYNCDLQVYVSNNTSNPNEKNN